MKTNICVYDFETDSPDPLKCNVVQLASCIIDYRTLVILDNSMFSINIRPATLIDGKSDEYFKANEPTIKWHAKNYGVEPKVILERWSKGHDEKIAFSLFADYIKQYNTNQSNKSKFTAPIRAGHNIKRFDNIIMDRLSVLHGYAAENGETKLFHPRDNIDLMELAFYWFENLREPSAYNVDALRQFFGIPTDGGHDALKDVKDEAWMVQKFMRLLRSLAPKVSFKKSYQNQEPIIVEQNENTDNQ